jgi:O-antigen ligase
MTYIDRRKTTATLGVALFASLLMLASTSTLESLHRQAFTSTSNVDSLAIFKAIARSCCVLVGIFVFIDARLRIRDIFRGGPSVLLAYYMFALGTTVYSAEPLITSTRAISFIAILLYGCVVAQGLARQRALPAFWQGLYVGFGLFTLVTLAFAIAFYQPKASDVERAAGLFTSNLAGSIAGIAVVWTYVRVLRGDFALTTIMTGLSGLALLLLTISRGALVAVFAICALATLMRRRTFTTALIGTTVLCLAGFAYALKAGDPGEKFAQYLGRGQDSQQVVAMSGRVPLWIFLATEQFPKAPYFGVGFQMLSDEGQHPSKKIGVVLTGVRANWGWKPTHAHDSILQTLIGTGLFGLTLFVVGWFLTQRQLLRAARTGNAIAEEAWFVLIFSLTHSLVDTMMTATVDPTFVMASIICGIATVYAIAPQRVPIPVREARPLEMAT